MSRMNNNRKGKSGANRQNKAMTVSRMMQSVIPRPPMIPNYQVVHSTRLRFTASVAPFDGNITFQNLLDTILFAATSVAGYDLFRYVKIRAIEAWCASNSSGTVPETVTIVYQGTTAGIVGDVAVHTDTSMSIEPAYVMAKPSARSLCSNWQISSSAPAFRLTCPQNSVVDIDLSFRQEFVSAVAAQNALVGATAGDIYLRGLDGVASSATSLEPVLVDYAI